MPTLADWLSEKPFGLTMSSGFFAFYAHCGMLMALEERRLFPASLSGASAGALVGGAWAAGVNGADIAEHLRKLERKDFWDPRPGLGLLAGRRFARLLDDLLPVARFEHCRVPFAASVWDVLGRKARVVDGGSLGRAIRASCAVPILFQPVWIERRPMLDGGLVDRPGLAGMSANRVLYHHIANVSPWRAANSLAMKIPSRANMTALVIDGLPKVDPFHLERGPLALTDALETTRRALDQPVSQMVRLTTTRTSEQP
jgi:NTE family protein